MLCLEGLTLAAAAPSELTHYLPLVASGQLDARLAVPHPHRPWRQLTAPLQGVAFPPRVHSPQASHRNRRLEEIWVETHRGQGDALLAELAYAFLLGLFGDSSALERWSSIVQGIYHCGDELPRRDAALFIDLIELLIAQQRLLPREQLEANTPAGRGAHYLSEDLEDTGNPLLIDAARRWATFCGGYHPSASAPDQLPSSLVEPTRTAASKLHEGALQKAEATLAEEAERSGQRAACLIPLLSHVGQLQELSLDVFAAIASQQRLLELGNANKVPADLLARGLQRLARLKREVGQGREADRLEQEALSHKL